MAICSICKKEKPNSQIKYFRRGDAQEIYICDKCHDSEKVKILKEVLEWLFA